MLGSRSPSTPVGRLQLRAMLHWALNSLPIYILVDSNVDESFIDTDLAEQINLPLVRLPEPEQVSALDGCLMSPATHHSLVALIPSPDH